MKNISIVWTNPNVDWIITFHRTVAIYSRKITAQNFLPSIIMGFFFEVVSSVFFTIYLNNSKLNGEMNLITFDPNNLNYLNRSVLFDCRKKARLFCGFISVENAFYHLNFKPHLQLEKWLTKSNSNEIWFHIGHDHKESMFIKDNDCSNDRH